MSNAIEQGHTSQEESRKKDIHELARDFVPDQMVSPEEKQRYASFLTRVRAGEVVEPGDQDTPTAYWKNAERMVGQHAYSELVGMQPEGEFLGRAPSLERERDLIAKVSDEAGHCLYYLNAFQGSRIQALADLYQGKMRYSVVFDDSPSREGGWAGITGIQVCVDGGAVINQTSLTGTSWGPYARANLQVTREEGMHVALGEETAHTLMSGTSEQQAMLARALRFWWSRGLMVNGPADSFGPWSLFSLQTQLKILSNDEAHRKYADRFYHIPQAVRVDVGNPLAINAEEFSRFLDYGGPMHAERMRVREQAFEQGAWVREALAARTGEREPPVYDIFIQEGPDKPFANMGSLLGTDELAPLLAARTFGRRPHSAETNRLAVARQSAVVKLTPYTNIENISVDDRGPGEYVVFLKHSGRQNHHFVEYKTTFSADSLADAVKQTAESFPDIAAVWIVSAQDLIDLPADQVHTICSPAQHREFLVPAMRGHFTRDGQFREAKYAPYPRVSHENAEYIPASLRRSLKTWLTAHADDSFLNAQRLSEWLGRSPLPESDLDLGYHIMHSHTHAAALYELAWLAGGKKESDQPNQAAYFRDAQKFRSAQITELPHADFAEIMVRQFLLKTFETLQLEQLQQSHYQPLAETAPLLLTEAKGDLLSTKTWLELLAVQTPEGRRRCQVALTKNWPYLAQLFAPINTKASHEKLVSEGYIPNPDILFENFQSEILPFLQKLNLTLPQTGTFRSVGKDRRRHTPEFKKLIQYRQSTARSQPPGTKW